MNAFAVLAIATALSTSLCAQDYPNRPIRILQGFAPGGNADNVARVVGAEMSKVLGQPILVESRAGAGGNLAPDAVAKAPPDGYTLLLAVGGHSVSAALYKSLPYRSVEDFEWISTTSITLFNVLVRSDTGAKSIEDLVRLARQNPGSVTFGSAGIGSTQHLTGELLGSMIAANLLHVPYKGDSAALTGLLGGETSMVIAPATAALQLVKSGRLRAIATTSNTRWAVWPDVPTIAEGGVPGFDVSSWAGLATTAGTPRPIVMRLNAEVHKALQVPEVRNRLESFGAEVRGSTPEEMRNRVVTEIARWSKVIREAKIPQQ